MIILRGRTISRWFTRRPIGRSKADDSKANRANGAATTSVPRRSASKIGWALVFAGFGLVTISGLPSGEGKRTGTVKLSALSPSSSQFALPLLSRSGAGVSANSAVVPSDAPQPEQGVVTRTAWMVQTDDFLENLRSESFWKRRGSSKRRASRNADRRNKKQDYSSRRGFSDIFGNFEQPRGATRKVTNDGNGRNNWDSDVAQDVASQFYSGGGNTYRTVCVRLCDGYYSPMSFSTTRSNFRRDQRKCNKRSGSDARLYVYRNPGETVDDMVDLKGRRYTELKTAFLFRAVYKPTCKSKPHPWQVASLDRHKLYRMKATVRAMRGKKRRQARLAMRQFKRDMKARRRGGSRQVALARQGIATQAQTSVFKTDDEVKRIASLSPVRALFALPQPGEGQFNVAVVPYNDKTAIFLPARKSTIIAMRLARNNQAGNANGNGSHVVTGVGAGNAQLAGSVNPGVPAGTVTLARADRADGQDGLSNTSTKAALSKTLPLRSATQIAVVLPTRNTISPTTGTAGTAGAAVRSEAAEAVAGLPAHSRTGIKIASKTARKTVGKTLRDINRITITGRAELAGGTNIIVRPAAGRVDLATIVVPQNDRTPIYLPSRNVIRGVRQLAEAAAEEKIESEEPQASGRKVARARVRSSRRMSLGIKKRRAAPRAKVKIVARPRPRRVRKRKNWKSSVFSDQR